MFERLQEKWKVSGTRLTLILFTFAIGGSLTGYIARRIMTLLSVDKGGWWILLYILLLTILWPMAVIAVSIPFGQFSFFRNYLRRVARKLGFMNRTVSRPESYRGPPSGSAFRLAIFASGAGTNAQKMIDHFRRHPVISISLIVSNRADAGVLKIAEKENIPSLLIEKERFSGGDAYVEELKQKGIDFLILAGFLWKIPVKLIRAFPRSIVNIHPALLPAHGGKGMYGQRVHEAVIAAKEKESGITIHYVDEIYDHGEIIFQAGCPVLPYDTPVTLAKKIHRLEQEHFSTVIEQLVVK